MRKGLTRKYKRNTSAFTNELSMTEMFEEFMLIKKGEGLAKRTVAEYYTNYQYFVDYIGRELAASEMTSELFASWITYMSDEMSYAPATINIRVRTMRSFLRYAYEDKQWIDLYLDRVEVAGSNPVGIISCKAPNPLNIKGIGALVLLVKLLILV